MVDALGSARAALPSLRTVVLAPIRPQTYLNLLYLGLAFPLGLAYFVALSVGFSLGIAVTLLVVGIVLLLAMFVLVLVLGTVERYLAVWLLRVDIPDPDWAVLDAEGPKHRVLALLLDANTWTALVFLATKLGVGVVSFSALVTLLVTSVVLVGAPLATYDDPARNVGFITGGPVDLPFSLYVPWQDLRVGVEFVLRLSTWRVDTLPEALLVSSFGVVVLVASLNALNGLAWLSGQYARLLLSPWDDLPGWVPVLGAD
ncbi:MAG: sensor domain-containing protein [Halanaeroarchaeum sp.]